MPSPTSPQTPRVVVLATGGTIAGTAAASNETLAYRSAQLTIERLLEAVPGLADTPLEAEQLAQLDSKDMDFETWRQLAHRVDHHVQRPEVRGVVVVHGTDTLEETAYMLQRVLAPAKPVVLTGAMHPATALQADGPQNLLDAVQMAGHTALHGAGVTVVIAGRVLAAADVRKQHAWRLDAFGSGDAGPLGEVVAGRWRSLRSPAPSAPALGLAVLEPPWPWVEIVHSGAGSDGRAIEALVAAGVDGLVVAGTGNGTLHHLLEAALLQAQQRGVAVRRSTRVASGAVLEAVPHAIAASHAATPVQARGELLLELAARRVGSSPAD